MPDFSSLTYANKFIDSETSIFWFRRDLRLHDNAGLYHALKTGLNVLPVFIFDSLILRQLEQNDLRVKFIVESLGLLKETLEKHGSSLLVLHGDPVHLFDRIQPKAVITNHDYEPYARKRDEQVKKNLRKRNILFFSYKDHVIFEKAEVVKDNGEPYTVFTPYSKKWRNKLNSSSTKSYPSEKYLEHLKKIPSLGLPSLNELGFTNTAFNFPENKIKSKVILQYHLTRDFPAQKGTSRIGVHLRFGTVSIRQLVKIALAKNETFLNELIWREFYHMILWHFPYVEHQSFKPAYDYINWRNDEREFEAWCHGMTGYPLVDAGMRELNETGFMHNRLRMVTASFLVKHLLIDWRWGEAYFSKKLLDYDLAANNGGWQWAAGCGCDAAPYFRVFNPQRQASQFDPGNEYILKWIPELKSTQYPSPIVDHQVARQRVMDVFKKALEQKIK